MYASDVDDLGRTDDLEVEGVVEYSYDERGWVARIDWTDISNTSAIRSKVNGVNRTSGIEEHKN